MLSLWIKHDYFPPVKYTYFTNGDHFILVKVYKYVFYKYALIDFNLLSVLSYFINSRITRLIHSLLIYQSKCVINSPNVTEIKLDGVIFFYYIFLLFLLFKQAIIHIFKWKKKYQNRYHLHYTVIPDLIFTAQDFLYNF
jgi:hypothetical protein